MSRARLSVLSASLFIAACGGGGEQFGGGGSSSEPFDITSTNGLTATKAAYEAAVASGNLANLGGSISMTSSTSAGVAQATLTKSADLVVSASPNAAFGPDESTCLLRGTVTLSGDLANPLTLTVNDTFTVVYAMCDDGAGEVIDGQIDFTVGDFTGDFLGGAFMLSMDAIVTNLQVVTSTDTFTSNGDTTLTLDTTDPLFVYAGTAGTSMTTDSSTSSETISGYQSSQTVDGNEPNLPYTLSASGTLDTTELEGIVSYSTPLQFSGEGLAFPSDGVLLVRGSGSLARLIAVDDVNVTIELDVNDDGVVDQTIETTWIDLTT